ncbi:MAG: hypothetical protein WBG80_01345 [Bacteroidota bacterium]
MRFPTPMRLSVLALFVGACTLSAPAGAQVKSSPKPRDGFASAGIWELGGSATFSRNTPVVGGNTGDAVYKLSAIPYVGYFLMDGLELGVNPLGVALTSGGDTTTTELRFLFAPSYNFDLGGRAYPFVEGLAGYTAAITDYPGGGRSTRSGFSWGGRLGVKFPVTARGLLNVGVQYLVITLDPKGESSRNGVDELSISLGFAVWL